MKSVLRTLLKTGLCILDQADGDVPDVDQQYRREHERRGISSELSEHYLTRHIRFELGANEHEGLGTFLRLANVGRPALTAQT